MRNVHLLLSVVWISCLFGCGPGYDVVPVSGTITLDGKPLANAMILTQPISEDDKNVTPGPGSIANTDSQGHFVLEMQHEDVKGAAPGKAYVKIVESGEKKASSDDTLDPSILRSKVPSEYKDGNKVIYEIPKGGTDAMNFDLKTKRSR